MIFKYIRPFLLEQSGAIMPMAAVMFPVLIGMVALGVDTSAWMMQNRNLQNAADAAAISAAWEIAYGYDDSYEESALREAQHNGYDPNLSGSELDVIVTVDEDGTQRITADLTMEGELWFSRILMQNNVRLANAAATAIVEPSGNYCILSLDTEADGAISAMGTAEVDANGCGLAVNSNSDSALDFTGSVVISVGDVSIVGDHDVSSNVDFQYDSMRINANPIPDPYADIDVPDCAGCSTYNNKKVNGSGDLQPGIYEGGLTISGNGTVNFAPGVYIIKNGDFKVTGNGTMYGEGVSFILTGDSEDDVGNINISGGKTSDFSAPEAGELMGGILFYQDRMASESSQKNSFTGSSEIDLNGVIYTPSRGLDFGGNNAADSDTCTKIVAKTVKLHGTPGIGNNCEGNSDIRDFGKPNVELVY